MYVHAVLEKSYDYYCVVVQILSPQYVSQMINMGSLLHSALLNLNECDYEKNSIYYNTIVIL